MGKNLVKKVYHKYTGKYSHIKKDVDIESKWFGNDYGGFYVYESNLSSDAIVYSFGIGRDISFDRELIEKFRCSVYGFDPTPKSIEWCEQQILPENFHFLGYGLAETSGTARFNLPKKDANVSGSIVRHSNVSTDQTVEVKMKSFLDIVQDLKHPKVDIVKMDIEGTEYDVLPCILGSKYKVDQLLIEFHERFFKDGKKKTIELLDKLRENGYRLFAISDSYQELSFIREDILI